MAVNFNASGRILKRTTSLPTTAAYTIAGWIRVRSVAARYQYFFSIEDAQTNASAWAVLGYASSGNFNLSNTVVADGIPPVFPVIGQWTFASMVLAGSGTGNTRSYTAPIGASSLSAYSILGTSFTPAMISIGNDSYDEYIDTDIANVMIWTAVLSEYELLQQMRSTRPTRWQDLYLWSPLRSIADVNDYSGNNNHWTIGGSPVGVENPPLDWRRQLWMVPFYVAAGGGAVTVTPAAASAAATAVAPIVVLGPVSVTPPVATAATSAIAPTVVRGAVTVTPGAAAAAGSAIAPIVVLGAITVTPTAASAAATAVAPIVVLGAVSVTPPVAAAATSAIAPTVVRGAVTVTPGAAAAAGTAIAPTVVLGAIAVTPAPAIAAATAVAPTVRTGGLFITPAAAIAASSAVAPTVILGAVVVTAGAAAAAGSAIAPTVVLGPSTVTPAPAIAAATAVAPTVGTGGAVTVTPAAAIAVATAVAPTVVCGPITVMPPPAAAAASAVAPSVLLTVLVAAVTLHARRDLALHAERQTTVSSVRVLVLTYKETN